MPAMPIAYHLLPKVESLLARNNVDAARKLLGWKFSAKGAGTQPDDRIVLTLINEAFWRKIEL